MSPTLVNFLFEAANLLVLAAALGWVFFKPVRQMLDAEVERHTKQDEETTQRRAEAESVMKQARAARESEARERDALRQQALEAARHEAAGLLEKARATQQAERQALEQERLVARAAEAAALAETVGQIAAGSVRALLEQIDGPSLDASLVQVACAALEAQPQEGRSPAQVESARPLDDEARRKLQGVLGGAFEDRVVPELGAGLRVTMPTGQVDATAASLARQAARAVSSVAAEPADGGQGPDA